MPAGTADTPTLAARSTNHSQRVVTSVSALQPTSRCLRTNSGPPLSIREPDGRVRIASRGSTLVSTPYRQNYLKNVEELLSDRSSRGADGQLRETRIAVGVSSVDRLVEVLLVELVDERPTKSVEVRHVEIVLLAERGELLVVGDRVELLVEIGESFRRLVGDPLLVVKPEMVFTFAIDDVADHDECDLRDGALAAEGGEIEIDHRTDGAVALPRRQPEAPTECVGETKLFETVSTLTVAFHRGVAFFVKAADVVAEIAVGRISASDTSCAWGDQSPAASSFVALEIGTRDSTITGTATQPIDVLPIGLGSRA